MTTQIIAEQAHKKTTQSTKTRLWFLTGMVVFGVLFAWLPLLDNLTSNYLNDSIGQAGIAFGSARAIDAVISMIQTSSLSLPFFSIDLGQMLDPLNDMVEDFSQVMTWALGSLILQKILFESASKDMVNWLLTVSAVLAVLALWFNLFSHKGKQRVIKVFVLLFSLRFIVLFSLLLNALVNSLFLDPLMEKNQQRLDASSTQMMELQKSLMGMDYQTQIDEIATKLTTIENKQVELMKQEAAYQPEINELNQKIKAKKDTLSWFEADAQLTAYQRELAPLVLERKKVASQIKDLKNEHEDLAARQRNLNAKLSGGNEVYTPNLMDDIEQIKKTSARLSSKQYWDEVELTSKNLIDAMIEGMVNFILKVILVPLLFLWLTKTWLLYFYRMFGLEDEGKKGA